jgi:hypothetical protein
LPTSLQPVFARASTYACPSTSRLIVRGRHMGDCWPSPIAQHPCSNRERK